MPRDLDHYAEQYLRLPFEPIQAAYRRQLVLSEVARHRPRRLLEIGCGLSPLFTDLPDTGATVVEPSPIFAANARRLAAGRADVLIVQGTVDDLCSTAGAAPFDMIVLSCLLHEVEDAQALLASVRRWCTPATVLHVNVPNARSLHRLLAVAMGLISTPEALSDTQRAMQQRVTYDAQRLCAELTMAGFNVVRDGSLFVKPFSHAQMQQLVDQGFMTTAVLDGLAALVAQLPGLGSEIWVEARAANA